MILELITRIDGKLIILLFDCSMIKSRFGKISQKLSAELSAFVQKKLIILDFEGFEKNGIEKSNSGFSLGSERWNFAKK